MGQGERREKGRGPPCTEGGQGKTQCRDQEWVAKEICLYCTTPCLLPPSPWPPHLSCTPLAAAGAAPPAKGTEQRGTHARENTQGQLSPQEPLGKGKLLPVGSPPAPSPTPSLQPSQLCHPLPQCNQHSCAWTPKGAVFFLPLPQLTLLARRGSPEPPHPHPHPHEGSKCPALSLASRQLGYKTWPLYLKGGEKC